MANTKTYKIEKLNQGFVVNDNGIRIAISDEEDMIEHISSYVGKCVRALRLNHETAIQVNVLPIEEVK